MAILQLEQVTYTYPGMPQPALRNLSLAVEPGEMVAIAGHNDAGKSTLCYALTGFVPHFFQGQLVGKLWIAGQSVADTPLASLTSVAGLVFQSPTNQLSHTKPTVYEELAFGLENLGIAPATMRDRIDATLHALDLTALATRSPLSLSGGEQQRVAIASILVMQPRILVLDEPTTQLDARSTAAIFALLAQRCQQGLTVVFATHNLEAIAHHATRVLVLHNGALVRAGAPATVLTDMCLDRWGVGYSTYTQVARQAQQAGILPPTSALPITLAGAIAHFRNAPSPCLPAQPATPSLLPRPANPIIRFEAVTFAYPQQPPTLQHIDLSIAAGEQVALLGCNGAGKTTLVKHLNGLLQPTQGTVWIGDRPTHQCPIAQLARSVGYGFQNPDEQLFCKTVTAEVAFGLHNLGLAATAVEQRVKQALTLLDLTAFAHVNPYDVSLPWRKLITCACVFAMQPAIVVLDEPTLGLDDQQKQRLGAALQHLRHQGTTLILISHDSDFVVQHCDRLLLLQAGHIQLDGPTPQVLQQTEALQAAGVRLPQITQLGMGVGLGAIASPTTLLAAYTQSPDKSL